MGINDYCLLRTVAPICNLTPNSFCVCVCVCMCMQSHMYLCACACLQLYVHLVAAGEVFPLQTREQWTNFACFRNFIALFTLPPGFPAPLSKWCPNIARTAGCLWLSVVTVGDVVTAVVVCHSITPLARNFSDALLSQIFVSIVPGLLNGTKGEYRTA